jgi:hypothetical protein
LTIESGASILLSPASHYLQKGETVEISATVVDLANTPIHGVIIQWRVSDSDTLEIVSAVAEPPRVTVRAKRAGISPAYVFATVSSSEGLGPLEARATINAGDFPLVLETKFPECEWNTIRCRVDSPSLSGQWLKVRAGRRLPNGELRVYDRTPVKVIGSAYYVYEFNGLTNARGEFEVQVPVNVMRTGIAAFNVSATLGSSSVAYERECGRVAESPYRVRLRAVLRRGGGEHGIDDQHV